MVAYRLSEEVKTILAYILYGLSWISWILLLGGLSGVQSSCDTIAIGSRNIEQLDPSGFNCSSIFAYMWWILVLQALWLIILGYFINKSVVAKWRTVVIAMQLLLAIKGQIMMFICNFLLLVSIAQSKLVPLLISAQPATATAAEEAAHAPGMARPASRMGTPHSRPASVSSSKLRPGEFTVPVPA